MGREGRSLSGLDFFVDPADTADSITLNIKEVTEVDLYPRYTY